MNNDRRRTERQNKTKQTQHDKTKEHTTDTENERKFGRTNGQRTDQ